MSQGNDFANYDSAAADSGSASEDVWFVAVSSDDIKQMSVDQLDEAFRLGLISAQTAVWTEGMEAWAPLGEVADLDADEGSSEASEPEFGASPFSAPAAAVDSSASQHLHQQQGHEQQLHQQQGHEQSWHNPFDAPAAPASFAAVSHHSQHSHSPSMGPSSFAPVTASYAPAAPGLAQSTGPVALNVDEDMPPVNRGRSWRPERWLLAAAGVAATLVVAFNNSDLFSSGSSAAGEKQASAASLTPRPYEAPAEKGSTVLAAAKLDDGKDAPIGSLVPAAQADDDGADKEPAAAPPTSVASSKTAASSKDVSGDMSKAFSGKKASTKPAKASKTSRATKARKPPSRAAKSKKSGVARSSSAFDPLNGSLP
jgi:hypothetical protein